MSLILLGILNSQVTAAGGAAYDLLETQILTGTTASVTFTGLGSYSDYKHLQIRATIQGNSTSYASMRLNSDSGSNYAFHGLQGNGSSVSSSSSSSSNRMSQFSNLPTIALQHCAIIWDILDFSNANKNTTVRSLFGYYTSSGFISLASGVWMNTNAVTDIEIFDQFANGYKATSRFSLYGVK